MPRPLRATFCFGEGEPALKGPKRQGSKRKRAA